MALGIGNRSESGNSLKDIRIMTTFSETIPLLSLLVSWLRSLLHLYGFVASLLSLLVEWLSLLILILVKGGNQSTNEFLL